MSELPARLAGRVGAAELTRRELEVLNRMAAGPGKEIATDLLVSQSTVKTHIHHIMTKLGSDDHSGGHTGTQPRLRSASLTLLNPRVEAKFNRLADIRVSTDTSRLPRALRQCADC